MAEPAVNNLVEWTVSDLSAALKRTVEDSYSYVRVRGEISGFKGQHSSGHCYFSLKDESAKIDAVIWRTAFARLRVKPEEGLEVIATGKLTTYPSRSSYQIVIETIELAGVGALMKLLEERKKKFAAQGLFDEARKQLLPYLPDVIGVVTSPTGAVIRDILHRLQDRFPRRVLVWPVRVQGETGAAEVANAIHGFNALPERGPMRRPDLIIVARGGGSLEDLWSFNEEAVVLAAAGSMIPLISAVGHETDFTLIDFAADWRAPTPTAAAEKAVPVRADLLMRLGDLGLRNLACWRRGVDQRRKELRLLSRALPALDDLLSGPRQRLDACAARLPRALIANAQIHHRQLTSVASRLSPRLLRARLSRGSEIVAALDERRHRCLRVHLDRRAGRVHAAGQLLNAYSYRGVLSRGFALVRDGEGRPLRAAASVAGGMSLSIEFADGRIGAVAEGDRAKSVSKSSPTSAPESVPKSATNPATAAKPTQGPAAKPRGRSTGPSGQGNLF
jgi:exodeoxyribonuclease VII large subunit